MTQPVGNPLFTSEREKHHCSVPFLPAIQWPCSLPGLHSLLEPSLRLTRLISAQLPNPAGTLQPFSCSSAVTPPHSAHKPQLRLIDTIPTTLGVHITICYFLLAFGFVFIDTVNWEKKNPSATQWSLVLTVLNTLVWIMFACESSSALM